MRGSAFIFVGGALSRLVGARIGEHDLRFAPPSRLFVHQVRSMPGDSVTGLLSWGCDKLCRAQIRTFIPHCESGRGAGPRSAETPAHSEAKTRS